VRALKEMFPSREERTIEASLLTSEEDVDSAANGSSSEASPTPAPAPPPVPAPAPAGPSSSAARGFAAELSFHPPSASPSSTNLPAAWRSPASFSSASLDPTDSRDRGGSLTRRRHCHPLPSLSTFPLSPPSFSTSTSLEKLLRTLFHPAAGSSPLGAGHLGRRLWQSARPPLRRPVGPGLPYSANHLMDFVPLSNPASDPSSSGALSLRSFADADEGVDGGLSRGSRGGRHRAVPVPTAEPGTGMPLQRPLPTPPSVWV